MRQKHWSKTVSILKIIINSKDKGIPLQIEKKLYFITDEYIEEFKKNDHLGWKDNAILIERIRKECVSYAINY